MKPFYSPAVMIAFMGILILSNCSPSVDRTKDFAMIHNQKPYRVNLASPIGKVIESDAGYTSALRFYVLFPTAANNPLKARGFQLQIDPELIKTDEVLSDSSLPEESKFQIEYYPSWGHKINQGILLAYSTGIDEGAFKVRFDIFEPRMGGRVKGEIMEATLFGYYEKQDEMGIIPPKKPKKLEIFNFSFDTHFQVYPY